MLNKMKKTRAGFTLVELIVVIAILAILAGVAIPVYSSYINRANKAADLTLLGAVNSAFAAACLEFGFDHTDVSTAMLTGTDSITGISGVSLKSGVKPAKPISAENNGYSAASLSAGAHDAELASGEAFNEYFLRYFGENKEIKLQYYTASAFVFQDGAFGESGVKGMTVTKENGVTTLTVTMENGKTAEYTVTDDQIQGVNNSTFGQNMTKSELMTDISTMTSSLAGILGGGNTIASIIGEDTLAALGVTPPYDHDELANAVVVTFANMLSSGEGMDQQMAASMSTQGSISAIQGVMNTDRDHLIRALTANNMQGMAGVLALYSTATAFANSDAASDAANDGANKWTYTDSETGKTYTAEEFYNHINSNIQAISARYAAMETHDPVSAGAEIMVEMSKLTALMYDSEGSGLNQQYQAYIDAGKLQADATGFIQSMSMISDNAVALADSGAIANGFDSASIEAILTMMFASSSNP